MKATGIVRRIDDLGRVVIPKEIRRTMRIREGDPLEIFTEAGGVIFKKYSPMGELGTFAAQYAEAIFKTCGFPAAVCDRDSVIAAAGMPKRELVEKPVSPELAAAAEQRKTLVCNEDEIPIADGVPGYAAAVIAPILAEGDLAGTLILAPHGGSGTRELQVKTAETAAAFLAKQLET